MAKNQVKKAEASGAPVKSRKPRLPGCNSPVDFPKGFRTKGSGIMKLVMSSRKKVKHHD